MNSKLPTIVFKIFSIFIVLVTHRALATQSLIQFNFESQSTSPSFVADGLNDSSPLTVSALQTAYGYGDIYGGYFLICTPIPNNPYYPYNPYPNSGTSISFTLNPTNDLMSLTTLSFAHFEESFNDAGGWPNFTVTEQIGTNTPTLIGTPGFNYSDGSTVPSLSTVTLPMNIDSVTQSVTVTIDIGAVSEYGSPTLEIDAISVSGLIESVPEPSTVALLSLSGVAVCFLSRKQSKPAFRRS
jgi:hypothetical protein